MPTKLTDQASAHKGQAPTNSTRAADRAAAHASRVKKNVADEERKHAPSFETHGDNGILTGTIPGTAGATDQDMAKKLMGMMKIDGEVWSIDRMKIGRHEMGFKRDVVTTTGEDKVTRKLATAGVLPLFSIQVWLKRRVQEIRLRNVFSDMFEAFKTLRPPVVKTPKHRKDETLFEISIADPHFGKLACGAETGGADYDVKITSGVYTKAMEGLIERAAGFPISRIAYVVGNDHFHVDSQANTTTAGTPQDVDSRFFKLFTAGRKAVADSVLRLLQIAPVDIIMVPGNHDRQTVFYLGEVLAATFAHTKHVTIDNSPRLRKYYHYGQNLIALTHGDKEKISTLPLLIATEQPEAWAKSKFREVHLGHLHQSRTREFVTTEEFNSVRVRHLPSISAADAWHAGQGYAGLRSATSLLWDKNDGMIAELHYNVK